MGGRPRGAALAGNGLPGGKPSQECMASHPDESGGWKSWARRSSRPRWRGRRNTVAFPKHAVLQRGRNGIGFEAVVGDAGIDLVFAVDATWLLRQRLPL